MRTLGVLNDYVAQAVKGDLKPRQQMSLIEAIKQLGGEQADELLRKIIEAETAHPTARVRALRELNAVDVAGIRDFLSDPRVDLRMAALELADEEWFHEHAGLVDALADLATKATSPDVRESAQRKLLAHPPATESTARAILVAWLDEPDPMLKSSFRRRVDKLREQGTDRLAQAAKCLTSNLRRGNNGENWLLLGRLRREGEEVKLAGVPFLGALSSSLSMPPEKDDRRPSLWRCMTLAVAGLALTMVSLLAAGVPHVDPEELVLFALGAWLVAAFGAWLFTRFIRPLNAAPNRLVPLLPQTFVALAVSAVFSLGAVLLLHLRYQDQAGLRALEGAELFAFFVLLVAFSLVRIVGGVAYGLAQSQNVRWHLQAAAGGLAGLALPLLACSLHFDDGRPLEFIVYIFFAPALIAVAMACADVDNAIQDRKAVDSILRRGIALAATAVAGLWIVADGYRAIFQATGSEDHVLGGASRHIVKLGKIFPVDSEHWAPAEVKATGSSKKSDIYIQIYKKEYSENSPWINADSLGGEGYEFLEFAAEPVRYLICVRDYNNDGGCRNPTDEFLAVYDFAHDFANDLESIEFPIEHEAETEEIPEGFVSLEIGHKMSDDKRQELEKFDNWINQARENAGGDGGDETSRMAQGYYLVAKTSTLQSSAPTSAGAERTGGDLKDEATPASEAVASESEKSNSGVKSTSDAVGQQAAGKSIQVSQGSILFEPAERNELVVVSGAWSDDRRVVPVTGIPADLVSLGSARPTPEQLDLASAIRELTHPADTREVSNLAWLEMLRAEVTPALVLLEAAAGSRKQPEPSVNSFALELAHWRTHGGGLFKLISEGPRKGVFAGQPVDGWRASSETEADCYLIRERDLFVLGDDDPGNSWRDVLQNLKYKADPKAASMGMPAAHRRKGDARDCVEQWVEVTLPRYADDDPLLKAVPLNESVLIDVEQTGPLVLRANAEASDVVLAVYDEQGNLIQQSPDNSAVDTESLEWAVVPGTYRVCVYRFEEVCEHDGGHLTDLEDLQRVAPETDPTVGSGYAWLEVAGGLSSEYHEAEDRFQGWLTELQAAGHDPGTIDPKSPSYFAAASDVTFPTNDGEVVIGLGSIMLARDQHWWVVQGSAQPGDMPFASAGPPEALLWLGNGNRPGLEQLAWAKLIAAEDGMADLHRVVRKDLESALRLGASGTVDLLENNRTLAETDPATVAPSPAYAAVLEPDGAGIFAVAPSEPGEAVLGRLVHGWNVGVTDGEACLQLRSKAILLEGGWDPAWADAVDELRALARVEKLDVEGSDPASPDHFGKECTKIIKGSLPQYVDDDPLLKAVPLNESVLIDVEQTGPLVLRANSDAGDVVLAVYDEQSNLIQQSPDNSAVDTESLEWAVVPGTYRVCVYRFEEVCEHDGGRLTDLDDLEGGNSETGPSVPDGSAWLRIEGGLTAENR